MSKLPTVLTAMASILLAIACTSDSVEEPEGCMVFPSYNLNVRAIIQTKCAFSGCHDGASGQGNYTSYAGLKRYLDNGSFKREVIEARTMPQSGELSSDEFEILRCWVENGFIEN